MGPKPTRSTLNISAAQVVQPCSGRISRVSVITSSSSAGAVYDGTATTGNTAANQVLAIPASAPVGTVYWLDWPMSAGIVAVPGSGGVLAVSYF